MLSRQDQSEAACAPLLLILVLPRAPQPDQGLRNSLCCRSRVRGSEHSPRLPSALRFPALRLVGQAVLLVEYWRCNRCPEYPRPSARLRHTHYRSEEHTSELQSLMRNSYAVFCLKKKTLNH